jgi:ribosome-binding factor A
MSKRTQQIGDEVQRILGEAVQYELRDPRVGFATIMGVDVSADLQHAQVRVSVLGDEEQQRETMKALEHAKGFLRRQVAQELRHLRFVPDLHFHLDTSLEYTQRIDEVLRQVSEERAEQQKDTDTQS